MNICPTSNENLSCQVALSVQSDISRLGQLRFVCVLKCIRILLALFTVTNLFTFIDILQVGEHDALLGQSVLFSCDKTTYLAGCILVFCNEFGSEVKKEKNLIRNCN